MLNENNYTTQDIELTLLLLHYFDVYHLRKVLVKKRDRKERNLPVQRQLNQREYNALMQRLLDQYGIAFFFPEVAALNNNSRSLAKVYKKLGDLTINPQDSTFSFHCYKSSFRLWPSPLNTASYKALLGGAILWQCRRIGNRLSRVARGVRIIYRNINGKPMDQWPRLLKDLWIKYQ